MFEVDEKEILRNNLLGDLFLAYTIFECEYKQIDMNLYLDFFYQIYYCLYNSDFSSDEMIFQYISKYDKFDRNALNILIMMIRNIAKKYGIRMERISEEEIICIQFTKKINDKPYFVEKITDLEAIKKSLVA